jgi:hypothetical protein
MALCVDFLRDLRFSSCNGEHVDSAHRHRRHVSRLYRHLLPSSMDITLAVSFVTGFKREILVRREHLAKLFSGNHNNEPPSLYLAGEVTRCMAAFAGVSPEVVRLHLRLPAVLAAPNSCLPLMSMVPVDTLVCLWQLLVVSGGPMRVCAVLRLRAGKGGFGKQLVRTGRMYASAKRRQAREANRNATALTRNLRGEMNDAARRDVDGSMDTEEGTRKRQRMERRAAAESSAEAEEAQRQVARERLVRLEQEAGAVAALQAAISAGFSRLLAKEKSASSIVVTASEVGGESP